MEMACSVLADDKKYNYDEENVKYTAQIIAEWTFHKCIDMFRSNIPKELWDDLIRKVASVIFEVVTKGIKDGIKSELILESVEQNINIAWEKRIKELYKNKTISTKCMLDAMRNSNIDRFSTAKQLEDCYNAAPKSDKEK